MLMLALTSLLAFVWSFQLCTPHTIHSESSRLQFAVPNETFADGCLRREKCFELAQVVRKHGNFTLASQLYEDSLAIVCANSSIDRWLRMWVQYQHADLLMRHIAPHVADTRSIRRLAITKFQEALNLSKNNSNVGVSPVFGVEERVHAYNSMGLLATELNDLDQAIKHFRQASRLNSSAHEPLGNLASVFLKLRSFESALATNHRALSLMPSDARLLHNMGLVFYHIGEEQKAEFCWNETLKSDASSTQTMVSLATLYGSRGDSPLAVALLERAIRGTVVGPELQSYRLQLAMSRLKMIYESREELIDSRRRFEVALVELEQADVVLPDPLGTVGSGSLGYYAIYQGYHDIHVRFRLAQIYRKQAGRILNFTAPHVSASCLRCCRLDKPVSTKQRRIRVGFHSAFLYHHSVGLLLSGIIRALARERFEVVVFIYDTSRHDKVTDQVKERADLWIVLPDQDLQRAQQLVAASELDLLVFSEIGMHPPTYFLAFSRLALRTLQFWGHAVTSGIGTIDYFISSSLFRLGVDVRTEQTRYAECLVEMEGLTTLFPRPPAPLGGLTRADFGLPDKGTMPFLVLVPQTLYKLHPDFDHVIQQILSSVSGSFLVLPVGDKPLLVRQLTRRWRRLGIIDADAYRRVFFVRQMNQTEFLALCEMSDLVIDPFPVGGGRSSFEVFSVGTPILGLTSRTTILQLTLGMYRRMGIDSSCCMFEKEDDLMAATVGLLRDSARRQRLRELIRRNIHKLYEASNEVVVREWESLFERILDVDPPGSVREGGHFSCANGGYHFKQTDNRSVYEIHVNGLAPQEDQVPIRLVRLLSTQDPFEVANNATSDLLQAAFLGKVLWNVQQRFRQRVVDTFVAFSTVSHSLHPIEIRYGDDLEQIVRWQLRSNTNTRPSKSFDAAATEIFQIASKRVPYHTTEAWREARALFPSREFSTEEVARKHCVALIVTTCKRLELFRRTMRSLQAALNIESPHEWHDHFCFILVIDDNSSEVDRKAMQAAFPTFSFLWKSPQQKGHAKSLNVAIARLHACRFVLYLEDDWEFRPGAAFVPFLKDTVGVLRSTQLAQVLLNDQTGGYTRQLMTDSGRVVPYAIHEFAVLGKTHGFSYWPGFSLNPGVWDLRKLSVVFDDDGFDETTDIFERIFSLRVWRAGLHIGYLHGVTLCDHIGAAPGTNASAYVLNGLPRRFD